MIQPIEFRAAVSSALPISNAGPNDNKLTSDPLTLCALLGYD